MSPAAVIEAQAQHAGEDQGQRGNEQHEAEVSLGFPVGTGEGRHDGHQCGAQGHQRQDKQDDFQGHQRTEIHGHCRTAPGRACCNTMAKAVTVRLRETTM